MKTGTLVERMRRFGTDLTEVEVKESAGGLPRSVVETISAFANGSGGVLILGLSERDGFRTIEQFNPVSVRDALARACADDLEPPVRAPIEIEEFEDASVVRLDVPGMDPVAKPCFVKARGAYQGSYIRSGDGDRRLTHYEVSQLLSNREQPKNDCALVEQATVSDLDPALVKAFLDRLRARQPRAFAELADTAALERAGAISQNHSGPHPTLAGLLCLGAYPQQFFPQLFVSFVSVPGLSMSDELADGTRFLDNQSCDGPIPIMIEEAVAAVRRNMRQASIIKGAGRQDRYDYPVEAVRELIVNAVMHRDYSPLAQGTQVQVELFSDRLVVKSPGGLYGDIEVSQLGVTDVSSSRNAVLAKLLADVPSGTTGQVVSENRGSGLPRVVGRLRDAGMSPPKFDATPSHVHVTIPQHALLDPETVEWIGGLRAAGLNDAQHLALAMMRGNGSVSNEMLRAWGVDAHTATLALTDLVTRGLANKRGGRRYATYTLSDNQSDQGIFDDIFEQPPPPPPVAGLEPKLAAVVEAVRAGHITSRAIQELLGLSYSTTIRRIREAREAGLIEETASKHSRAQSYRLRDPADR
jgi:ATP-dependent DNA helicase RecG